MAKLTKHAEVLNQLHTMVKKQAAEAQSNISGAPGEDVTAESISPEHESTNKNSVGPENNPQGYSQKPSEDKSEPLTSAKTAESIGAEILDIIRKEANAQEGITGKPGADVKAESINKSAPYNKNQVKPEGNKPQAHKQEASKDSSEPLTSAKKAEVEDLAAKVASYELGRQFCAAILKTAGDISAPNDAALMKEAGRRDFDLLIAEAAESLESGDDAEKTAEEAEEAGAAYFDEVLKEAALEEAVVENVALSQKLAEYQNYYASEQTKAAQWNQALAAQQQQVKLAETVADIVLGKLKTEIANTPAA